MNQYGYKIRELRTKNKLTQTKLAEMVEVDVSHISRIENGKGSCSIIVLQKIAAILGVSVSELLGDIATQIKTL